MDLLYPLKVHVVPWGSFVTERVLIKSNVNEGLKALSLEFIAFSMILLGSKHQISLG